MDVCVFPNTTNVKCSCINLLNKYYNFPVALYVTFCIEKLYYASGLGRVEPAVGITSLLAVWYIHPVIFNTYVYIVHLMCDQV